MRRSVLVAVLLAFGALFVSDAVRAQAVGNSRKTPAAAKKQTDQWALLIGVNDYPGEIQDLRFARDDARAIRDLLISSAGYLDDHVILLTDDGTGENRATRQNIFDAIEKRLATRVQSGHQVLVFLAGHGIVRGLGPEARSYYLPADVDARSGASVESTGIDMEEISRKLSTLKASQFTVFVDACREDPFPGRGLKGNTMTDVMARVLRIVPSKSQQVTAEPPTSVIFYACKIGERAFENVKLQHGVFTYYILQGLRELASRPDGRVEAGQLAGYLRENVGNWVKQNGSLGAEQTPTMTAVEVRGPVLIARISPIGGAARPVATQTAVTLIASPEGAALSINGRAAGSGPLRKVLTPGQYTVRAELAGFKPVETAVTVLSGYEQEVTLTLDPVASNPHYDRAVEFESQQLWPQAIASYQQALRDDPEAMAVYERLAFVYLRNGRYREAVDLMSIARQKFPDQAAILAMRSRTLSAWASSEEQTGSSESVSEVEPESSEKKKKSDSKKDDESSEQSSKKKSGKKGGKKDSRNDKDEKGSDEGARSLTATAGAKSAGSGTISEALADAELAVRKAPNLAAAHLALGFACLLDPSTRSRALDAFVLASTLSPDDAEAYYGVGYSYRLNDQYQQAIPQFRKAIELRPDYYEAQRELAYCYHTQGRTDDAIRQYQVASAYRGKTRSKKDVAANNLALSALYRKKGEEIGGAQGEEYKKAGKGYEDDAREHDPKLTSAAAVLHFAGVSKEVENYVPVEAGEVIKKKLLEKIGIPFNNRNRENETGKPVIPGKPAIKLPAVIKTPEKPGSIIKPKLPVKQEEKKAEPKKPLTKITPKTESKEKSKDVRETPKPKSPVIAPKITVKPGTESKEKSKEKKPEVKLKSSTDSKLPVTLRKNIL